MGSMYLMLMFMQRITEPEPVASKGVTPHRVYVKGGYDDDVRIPSQRE